VTTALLLSAALAAAELPAPPDPTPGLGLELGGLLWLRQSAIDGGFVSGFAPGALATFDGDALGAVPGPLHLFAELLVTRLGWGADQGTDALEVTTVAYLTSPRLRVGVPLGERLRLEPYLVAGPALLHTEVTYLLDDPLVDAAPTTTEVSGFALGGTAGLGARLSWPIEEVLVCSRLELALLRRGSVSDLGFLLTVGAQLGHATPDAPAPR